MDVGRIMSAVKAAESKGNTVAGHSAGSIKE